MDDNNEMLTTEGSAPQETGEAAVTQPAEGTAPQEAPSAAGEKAAEKPAEEKKPEEKTGPQPAERQVRFGGEDLPLRFREDELPKAGKRRPLSVKPQPQLRKPAAAASAKPAETAAEKPADAASAGPAPAAETPRRTETPAKAMPAALEGADNHSRRKDGSRPLLTVLLILLSMILATLLILMVRYGMTLTQDTETTAADTTTLCTEEWCTGAPDASSEG